MTDAELDRLDRLCQAATAAPWNVGHNMDNCEGFSIESPTSTICWLEEDEPGDIDDDLRKQIAANFGFMSAARHALPVLIAEIRRLLGDTPLIVGS